MGTSQIIPYKQLISSDRSDNTIIAWRESEALTVSDFRQKISQIAHEVQKHSAQNWAVYINDCFLFAASLFALLIQNKTPVILGHTREALLQEQSEFYDAILTDTTLTTECYRYRVDQKTDTTYPLITELNYTTDAQLLLFTSGSTAKPKAIVKPIRLLEKESFLLAHHYGARFGNKKVISTISHLHLYGITFRILLPLVLGIPFDINQIYYPESLPSQPPQDYVLISSPAFLKRLDAQLTSSAFVEIFSAGGILPFEHAQQTRTILGQIPTEIYGSSETGIIAHRQQKTLEDNLFYPFVDVYIQQDEHHLIQVQSPLFEAKHTPQLNDIVEICGNGFLLKGRTDKVIKIEEKRIAITEVEARIKTFAYIQDVVVFPLEEKNRIILAAVIVLSSNSSYENHQLLFKNLRRDLKNWLEPVAIPRRWRLVKEIPQNSQGKQNYYDLKALFI